MSKRSATSELNHENWDLEDQTTEESGTFSLAPNEEIKKRIIRTAKRRINSSITTSEQASSKPLFTSFTNIVTPKQSEPKNIFSFLSTASDKQKQGNSSAEPFSTTNTDKSEDLNEIIVQKELKNQIYKSQPTNMESKTELKPHEKIYFAALRGLNETFAQHIKFHVDKNACIDFTPVFKDYEDYLKKIKTERDEANKKLTETKITSEENKKKENKSLFSSGSVESKKESGSIFSGFNKVDKKDKEPSSFSFGNTLPAGGFSFGSGQPFKFGNIAGFPSASKETDNVNGDDEEDIEPPKNVFTPVLEENSLYDQKVKIFYKTESGYSDRGVGTLFIKKVNETNKHQVIVRADTNLGNILLNIVLQEQMPLKRVGKNNVMLVCIPTPEYYTIYKKTDNISENVPIPVLIRVKTEEVADKLLADLEKYKKAS